MDNPKISWKVYSQNAQDYEDNNDFFAGTYKYAVSICFCRQIAFPAAVYLSFDRLSSLEFLVVENCAAVTGIVILDM